jgi:hypothetical protein
MIRCTTTGDRYSHYISRTDGYFPLFMFGKSHYLCLECLHTVSGTERKPRCPKGHGYMHRYDDRLRVPKRGNKRDWKRFWAITKITPD